MTECQELQASLSAHIDGALPEADAWVLDEHLRDCMACQAERAALAQVAEPSHPTCEGLRPRSFLDHRSTGRSPKATSRARSEVEPVFFGGLSTVINAGNGISSLSRIPSMRLSTRRPDARQAIRSTREAMGMSSSSASWAPTWPVSLSRVREPHRTRE